MHQNTDSKMHIEILTHRTSRISVRLWTILSVFPSWCRSTAGAAPCLCPGDTPLCSIPAVDSWTGRCPGLSIPQLLAAPCTRAAKSSAQKTSRMRIQSPGCTGGHCQRRSPWFTVLPSDLLSLFHLAADTAPPAHFPGISPLTLSIPKPSASAGGCREEWSSSCASLPLSTDTKLSVNIQKQQVRYAGLMNVVRCRAADVKEL